MPCEVSDSALLEALFSVAWWFKGAEWIHCTDWTYLYSRVLIRGCHTDRLHSETLRRKRLARPLKEAEDDNSARKANVFHAAHETWVSKRLVVNSPTTSVNTPIEFSKKSENWRRMATLFLLFITAFNFKISCMGLCRKVWGGYWRNEWVER